MTELPETTWPARLGQVLASRWAVVGLVIVAFGVSMWVQQAVYPGLSWNRDEPVYLWHVDVLRAGQLSVPDGGHPDVFQPWLSAARDGKLFSQYTLGWPLVLLAGALLGSADLGVAFGAALAVGGTWALVNELLRDRTVATLAAGLLLISPVFALQSGVHLNYLFTLGLGLLFVTALLRGVRGGSRLLLVASGALLGWIFLTRPYDAVIWGLVATVPLLVQNRRAVRPLLGRGLWAMVGLLPLVAVTLLLNRHLTGSLTEFPITVADPLDRFGFGDRRLMPGFGRVPYGKRLALESLGRNSFWLPWFLVGAPVGVAMAVVGAWVQRRRPATWVLVAIGLAFPVAYFPFFGTHVSSLTARLSGPIYFIPAYVPLCALAAIGLVHLARRRPPLAALAGVLLLAVTVPVTVNRLGRNHALSEANLPWADSVAEVEGRALVVTSPEAYLLYLNPFGDNGADLDGRILYASDVGPDLFEVLDEHPDRVPYLQRSGLSTIDLLPSERPRTPEVSLTPLEVLTGDVRLHGEALAHEGTVTVWWISVDGARVTPAHTVEGAAAPIDVPLAELGLPAGLHTLEVRVGLGADAEAAAHRPRALLRYYVRVEGGAVELLTPATALRYERREGAARGEWEDRVTLTDLTVLGVVDGS